MPQLADILKTIHIVDIILVVIIAGFALLGFTRGAVKLFIVLAGIYLGFVVGAIYYLPLSELLQTQFNLGLSRVAQILAFLLINAVVAILLVMLLLQFFGHLEVQGRLGACVDRPLGMLVGFLTGILLTAILVIMIEAPYEYFSDVRLAGSQAPFLDWLHEWYATSTVADLLRQGLPVLLASVRPLLGGHEPPILVNPQGAALLPVALLLVRLPRAGDRAVRVGAQAH